MVRGLQHPRKADKAFENIVLAETLPARTRRDRDARIGRKNDCEGGVQDAAACGAAATAWTSRHRPSLVKPIPVLIPEGRAAT